MAEATHNLDLKRGQIIREWVDCDGFPNRLRYNDLGELCWEEARNNSAYMVGTYSDRGSLAYDAAVLLGIPHQLKEEDEELVKLRLWLAGTSHHTPPLLVRNAWERIAELEASASCVEIGR